jgi:UTP--glucose-1-phosphate uridylyltransferase
MSLLRKAVIPAAGLGTRFLPATKSVPKEMLPLVDKPILLYIVEEAVRSGVEDIVLIQGRGKGAIEDFFDTSFELEATLEKTGKLDLLESIRKIKGLANIISVRQKEALGLGHAVHAARPIVGDEPFALLLGDEIMIDMPGRPPATAQLASLFEKYEQSAVAVIEVDPNDVSKYGIVKGRDIAEKGALPLIKVEDIVEKPDRANAPSRLALPGRYVFDAAIFKYLENAKPGKNGEIQLTDSMTALAQNEGLLAAPVVARRYDAGDKFGYLQANIELALDRPELRGELVPYLKSLAQKLLKEST